MNSGINCIYADLQSSATLSNKTKLLATWNLIFAQGYITANQC